MLYFIQYCNLYINNKKYLLEIIRIFVITVHFHAFGVDSPAAVWFTVYSIMTGVVYDDDFTRHRCLWDENYSENPQRYTSILDR